MEELEKCENEITILNMQVPEQQKTCKALKCENDELNKTVDEISRMDLKGIVEGSRIQFQLEEDLKNTKDEIFTLMDINSFLMEKLHKVKTDLEKMLKWAVSLPTMANPNCQRDGSDFSARLIISKNNVS